VEYLNCVGSLIANCVIKYRIAMAKATFKKKKKKEEKKKKKRRKGEEEKNKKKRRRRE